VIRTTRADYRRAQRFKSLAVNERLALRDGHRQAGSYELVRRISTAKRACGKLRVNEYSASGRAKKAGILVSGLFDHEMVAGGRFELTTFRVISLKDTYLLAFLVSGAS